MNYALLKDIDLNADQTGNAQLFDETVIVPIYDLATNEPIGSQFIHPDGTKRFSKGFQKLPSSGLIIGSDTQRMIVAEGWATSCAVHKFTKDQVVWALDAGHLPKVCEWLRFRYPDRTIVVAADNDNCGRDAAIKSGLAYSCPTNGKDWDDEFRASGLKATLDLFERGLVLPEQKSLGGLISGDALMAKEFQPVKFIFEELVPEVGLTLIAGAPKEGKSWLALQIHCYLADNGLQSLYIGFEDNERRLKSRFQSLPCKSRQNAFFRPGITADGVAFPKGAEALEALKQLKASQPGLACIILDTVASIRQVSSREKSYEFTVQEFSSLRSLAHNLGIALIAVHHTRKSNQSDNSPLERILGSQGIAATAETCMVLTARTGSRDKNLFVTGKDVEQQDVVLKWQDPGFQIVYDDLSYGLPLRQRDVLNAIAAHPRCTQAAIAAVLDMDKSQLSHIVSKLIELGRVERIDDGRLIATQP